MKIISQFSKKKLIIDNIGQNLMDPITYNKTISKLTQLDPKYEHIRQDPYMKKQSFFEADYLVNLKRYPDDNEVLIDIDKFRLIPYLQTLFQTNSADIHQKDVFPQKCIYFTFLFILFQLTLHSYLKYYQNEYPEERKEKHSEHFEYQVFSENMKFQILLFRRSTEI